MKCAILIGLGIAGACLVHAQPSVTRSVVAGGGATLSSGVRFQLGSTLGQPNVSASSGSRFSVQPGFWIQRAPVMFAAKKMGTNFVFGLQTELGKTYSVQYSDSFSNPNWQTVLNVMGDGSVQTVTNAASTGTGFFRLVEH